MKIAHKVIIIAAIITALGTVIAALISNGNKVDMKEKAATQNISNSTVGGDVVGGNKTIGK